jgi:hypothetical protein
MTDHILCKVPFLGKFVDERFLEHRRRSTSLAGIMGCLLAGIIFEYRLIFHGQIAWDLFAVIVTMGLVKVAMMLWFRYRD